MNKSNAKFFFYAILIITILPNLLLAAKQKGAFGEVSAGYGYGKFKQEWSHTATAEKFDYAGSSSGYGLGMDFGGFMGLLYGALDITYNKLSMNHKITQYTKMDATNMMIGVKAGSFVKFKKLKFTKKMPLRIWAGYALYDKMSFTFNDTSDDISFTGTAIKGGLGMIMKRVSINFEYIMHTYNKFTETQSKTTDSLPYTTDNNVKKKEFKYNALFVSLSFPFRIGRKKTKW